MLSSHPFGPIKINNVSFHIFVMDSVSLMPELRCSILINLNNSTYISDSVFNYWNKT